MLSDFDELVRKRQAFEIVVGTGRDDCRIRQRTFMRCESMAKAVNGCLLRAAVRRS